jgi:hypothetical protein
MKFNCTNNISISISAGFQNFSENSVGLCKTQALKFINYLTHLSRFHINVYEIASMKDYHHVLMISIR